MSEIVINILIAAGMVHFLVALFVTIKVFGKKLLDVKTEENVFKLKNKIKWSLFVWLVPFIGSMATSKYLKISWTNGSPVGFGDHIGGGGGDSF